MFVPISSAMMEVITLLAGAYLRAGRRNSVSSMARMRTNDDPRVTYDEESVFSTERGLSSMRYQCEGVVMSTHAPGRPDLGERPLDASRSDGAKRSLGDISSRRFGVKMTSGVVEARRGC